MTPTRITRTFFFGLICSNLLGSQFAMSAAQCVKHSPAHTVALLELYTSEGCSGCPPADRWLSRISQFGLNQDQVIPLSMHVDYWDSLGWKDRFASPVFTERQRVLARQAQSGFVYTPEFFVSRKEFRNAGAADGLLRHVATINGRPAMASIEMVLQPINDGILPVQINIELKPVALGHRHTAYVAVYENDLSSQVSAGENHGATLHHDYVVRRWIGPISLTNPTLSYQANINVDPGWKRSALGVVAFVEDTTSGELLQTTSLAACATAP